jgi:hypothetical protein
MRSAPQPLTSWGKLFIKCDFSGISVLVFIWKMENGDYGEGTISILDFIKNWYLVI